MIESRLRDGAAEPLDDVGIHVGGVHLDGGGQVEDHRTVRRRLDDVHDRFADLDGELGLGAGEALRRVLVADVGVGHRLLELLAQPGRVHGDVDDPGLVEAEDDPALQLRRRVVEVHDGAVGADQGFERALDQLLPALDQHLDRHVVGDDPLFDDVTLEVEVGLGGRREANLDLLEADVDQGLEQGQLALRVHRVDEGLVAVTQVDAGPTGGPGELAVRPGPILEHAGARATGTCRRAWGTGHRAGPGDPAPCRHRSLSVPWPCSLSLRGTSSPTPTATGPTKNPLAEVAQEVASERYVAFAVR